MDKATSTKPEQTKRQKGKVARKLAVILILLVFVGCGIGYYFFWVGDNYLTTDNAKVSAKFYSILPMGSGKLTKFFIYEGSTVTANQIIGKVDNVGYLRSPIDGEVVQVNVALNQLVGPATVTAVVADTTDIYVLANIEETEIAKVQVGQNVQLVLDAYPGKTYAGYVREIDRTTQTAISGNTMSYTTSGTYTKVTQLIPVKVQITEPVEWTNLIGTNATVTIAFN